MSVAEYFKQNRYVYLSNVLSKDDCEKLTEYMFSMYDAGKLERDPQCPLSDSIYGSEIFDGILEKICGPLSAQLGVELLPAYTYARIYRPGEELVKHKDRESCEISGTMTLGFDPGSGIWPIFFGRDDDDLAGTPFEIGVGDLVMYHGNELNHWRPKYKGNWQVQVFFHYVDANGPHRDHAYDGRKKLGVDKRACDTSSEVSQAAAASQTQSDLRSAFIENGVIIRTGDEVLPGAISMSSKFMPHHCFSAEECERVLKIADKQYATKSTVGNDQNARYAPEIRAVDNYSISYNEENAWIFRKIAAAVGQANAEYFKYDLYGIVHDLQLLHYKATENGHYDWHADVGPGSSAYRKISISIPLTSDDLYEGGELEINNNGVDFVATREQGSLSMFPSYLLHRVKPVTKGERWVIVVWINGPRFK